MAIRKPFEIPLREVQKRMALENPWWVAGAGIDAERRGWPQRAYFGPFMRLVREVDGRPLDAQRLRALVAEGRFQVGLRVPAGLTAAVTLRAEAAVADGLAGKPAKVAPRAEALEVVFEPLAGGAFRSAVVHALERVYKRRVRRVAS